MNLKLYYQLLNSKNYFSWKCENFHLLTIDINSHANNDQDKWLIDNFFGDFSNSNGDINPINVINVRC